MPVFEIPPNQSIDGQEIGPPNAKPTTFNFIGLQELMDAVKLKEPKTLHVAAIASPLVKHEIDLQFPPADTIRNIGIGMIMGMRVYVDNHAGLELIMVNKAMEKLYLNDPDLFWLTIDKLRSIK